MTLEDILEEIVGDFTSDPSSSEEILTTKNDNVFIIDGGVHVREINQELDIKLIAIEAITFNGFLLEHSEYLPEINDIIKIQGHTFKVLENIDNAVKTVHLEVNNDKKK